MYVIGKFWMKGLGEFDGGIRTVTRMLNGVREPPEKMVIGYQFITRRENENGLTIALESGQEIGNKATAGYFTLPKEQIKDLRYSDEDWNQDDAKTFNTLIGFASNPFKTRSSNVPRFPPGYALASFKDGSEHVLSRTALRKMLGKTDADYEIQECEIRNNIIPAWSIEPQFQREPRTMVVGPGKRHKQEAEAEVKTLGGGGRRNPSKPSQSIPPDTQGMDELKNEMAELRNMFHQFMLEAKEGKTPT